MTRDLFPELDPLKSQVGATRTADMESMMLRRVWTCPGRVRRYHSLRILLRVPTKLPQLPVHQPLLKMRSRSLAVPSAIPPPVKSQPPRRLIRRFGSTPRVHLRQQTKSLLKRWYPSLTLNPMNLRPASYWLRLMESLSFSSCVVPQLPFVATF